jgi:uncharacterized protein (TIRG00374 family)
MPRSIKIVIACTLLLALALGVDWEAVPGQLAQLDWKFASIGLSLVALEMVVNAWKWSFSLRLHDLRFPWSYLFRTGCFGYFFNNFLPSAIGGDVYRIYRTMTPAVARSRAVSAVVVERAIGFGAMLLIGTIGALLLAGTSALARWYLAFAALGAVAVLIVSALLALGWLDRPRALLARIAWLQPVRDNLQRVLRPRIEWVGLLAASFAFQILAVAVVWLAFAAIGSQVSVAAAAIITAAAGIASVLPITISGLGVVEGSIAGTAVAVGIQYDSAVLAAIAVRMLGLMIGAGCGLLYLAESGIGPTSPEAAVSGRHKKI